MPLRVYIKVSFIIHDAIYFPPLDFLVVSLVGGGTPIVHRQWICYLYVFLLETII